MPLCIWKNRFDKPYVIPYNEYELQKTGIQHTKKAIET